MSDFEEDSGLEEAAPLPTAGKIGDESRTLNSTAEDEQAVSEKDISAASRLNYL